MPRGRPKGSKNKPKPPKPPTPPPPPPKPKPKPPSPPIDYDKLFDLDSVKTSAQYKAAHGDLTFTIDELIPERWEWDHPDDATDPFKYRKATIEQPKGKPYKPKRFGIMRLDHNAEPHDPNLLLPDLSKKKPK